MATYDRGTHIRPTIESVLAQSFGDYEVIVVADGCTDDTLDVVRSYGSPKIATYELAENSGSQSAPNNFGIARAAGEHIAYLGHDDVWHPRHLAELAKRFRQADRPDVVTAGCAFHGPAGHDFVMVTGMLDAEHTAAEHFLPPSALAHVRELTDRIGGWRDPRSVTAPVDTEIMLRAVAADARFASTGTITVHKYAAGHRYLSYLRPSSTEQSRVLAQLHAEADPAESTAALAAAARAQNRFMMTEHHDYDAHARGTLFDRNRANKGLRRPPLRQLDGAIVLRQTGESRGVDWHELEVASAPYRWSGPSRAPRLLIPFASDASAAVTLDVLPMTPPDVVAAVSFEYEGRRVPHVAHAAPDGGWKISLELPLRVADYTVLEIDTPSMFRAIDRGLGTDTRLIGLALGDVELAPRAAAEPR